MERNQFDERQLQIRGNIFKHGFLAAIAALLINAFLQGEGIVWARPFDQNILIIVLILTVFSAESHIHGVFFGKSKQRVMVITLLGSCALILTVISGIHFVGGARFAVDGGLTSEGVFMVHGMLFLLNTVCSVIQLIKEKKSE